MSLPPPQRIPLPQRIRDWVDASEYAVLATVLPGGQPQLSVMWVTRDGDDLLLSTVRGRQKERNLTADPRATVLVYPKDDPYSYVEVRGRMEITDEGGDALISALSQAYTGVSPYPKIGPDEPRVVLRLIAEKVVER